MKDALQKIKFHYQYPSFFFPHRNKLKIFLLNQLHGEGKKVETINYIFCDDNYLLQLNRQFLKHDTLTDIITFELSQRGQPILSDIYISIDRIKENAVFFKQSFNHELMRIIFHGALHLAGYKDKTMNDTRRMREKEEMYLQQFYVSRKTVS